MQENPFDLLFFCGVAYCEKELNLTKEKIANSTCNNKSDFLKILLYKIQKLSNIQDLHALCKNLSVTIYFLELIISDTYKSGACNICGKYLVKLDNHLKVYHCLDTQLINYHMSFYSDSCYYYMPEEFRLNELELKKYTYKSCKKPKSPETITCADCGKNYKQDKIHFCYKTNPSSRKPLEAKSKE